MRNTENKIKFALMTNGNELASWQMECIDKLIKSNIAELVLLILNDNEKPKKKPRIQKLFHKNLIYNLWKRMFLQIPAETSIPFTESLRQIDTIKCKTTFKGKHAEYFSTGDIEYIKSAQPKFILRFGFNILKGEILSAAEYGIWSYHHGNEQEFRGGPPGLWEIFNKKSITGVIFQRLTEKLDAGIIIEKRFYKTIKHSYKEQKQKLLTANTDMPLLAAKRIFVNDTRCFFDKPSQTSAKIYSFPDNLKMFAFIFKLMKARLSFYYNKYFLAEQWGLAFIKKDGAGITSVKNFKCDRIILHPEKNIFYADAFLFSNSTKKFCICEKYNYTIGRGTIAIIDAENTNALESIALSAPHHLAYPYIFQHQNINYLIPETADDNCCKIYTIDGNNQIHFVSNLLNNIRAVDSSLLYDGKYFWIFCGIKNDYPNEKLFAFYSETLTGNYSAHTKNPVKVTPEGARCGGTIFYDANDPIRPAQYSANYYGEKVMLQKITKLSPDEFEEVLISEIEPIHFNKKWKGVHTFSKNNSTVLIDFKIHVFIFSAFIKSLRRKR